jgi:hypothetical protein
MSDKKHDPDVYFYEGDILVAVDVLDEDGEPCEGRMVLGELVLMKTRSSQHRPYIIVERASGKEIQLQRTRFALHERAEFARDH